MESLEVWNWIKEKKGLIVDLIDINVEANVVQAVGEKKGVSSSIENGRLATCRAFLLDFDHSVWNRKNIDGQSK